MRTVSEQVSVRLYHLDVEGNVATTVMYGTMAEAVAAASAQSDDVQDGLYLQTPDDVVAWRDFAAG